MPCRKQGRRRNGRSIGQGAAPSAACRQPRSTAAAFYVSPTPDDVYTAQLQLRCAIRSRWLTTPTVEALPYFWTDAVPFFAAYFALMSAQTNARMADAAQMYKGHYNEFMDRARKQSNPGVNN